MVGIEKYAHERDAFDRSRTRERILPFSSTWNQAISLGDYWNYLIELIPQTEIEATLAGVIKLLNKNPQVSEKVLFPMFRLVEGIQLWHLHQGQSKSGIYNRPEYTAKHVKGLFDKVTAALNKWEEEVFSGDGKRTLLEQSRNHYEPAAKFILSTSATLFASLSTLSSPEVKAHTTRMALALLDKEAKDSGYLRSLLTERALQTGVKDDIGEDAFYETLTELIASWSPEQRLTITKQLGDMLGISVSSEENQKLSIPVTQAMANMAVLLLTSIRQHNQNDADFGMITHDKSKQITTAARGGELGSEPLLAMAQHLKKSAEHGSFDIELAHQLFEALIADAQLANPAILLRIVETFAHPKLREALQKAYSRRDATLPTEKLDDVLMYLLTGTLVNHLPHGSYSLNDRGLGWATDNLSEAGYANKLADFIRTISKFGLHTLKGVNPLPQMYIVSQKDPSAEQDMSKLQAGIKAAGTDASQVKKISKTISPFLKENNDGKGVSIIGPLVVNREKLGIQAKESLKIRMRRWLEVEEQIWSALVSAAKNYREAETTSIQTTWTLYFTAGLNLLSQPESDTFQIDPELVKEFAPVLAERIILRRIAIEKGTEGRDGTYLMSQLKDFTNWALNQAAAHWDGTMVDAVLNQMKVQVGKDDGQYFTSLIPDVINNIALEGVAKTEGTQPGRRTENQEKVIKTLIDLLVSFSRNTSFVSAKSRGSLITLLENISGDLSDLIKRWDNDKELRYLTHQSTRHDNVRDRELAAVARLLDLLAGHSDSGSMQKAANGQTLIALAINEEIGKEIGVMLQTYMPSNTLMTNLLESHKKLSKQQDFSNEKREQLSTAAGEELKKITKSLKGSKLSLNDITELIGTSIGKLGESITAANQLKLNFPNAKQSTEKNIGLYTLLANLAQQYLSHAPAPEISPLGHELAEILRAKHHNENLATLPLEQLRQKIAAILSEKIGASLVPAVEQEAELAGEQTLAQSMKRYFANTDLLIAVETAHFTKEDLRLVEEFFNQVKFARKQVIDPTGSVERSIKQIKTNMGPILRAATHLIAMPKWEDIAWFIPDDVFTAAIERAKKNAKD